METVSDWLEVIEPVWDTVSDGDSDGVELSDCDWLPETL